MIGITEEKTLGQESVGLTKTKPLQTLLKLRLNDLLNTCMTNIQSMDVGLILWMVHKLEYVTLYIMGKILYKSDFNISFCLLMISQFLHLQDIY